MALNALGSPLVLQASSQQVQALMQGLRPGDLLKGRLVEILPQGKAVLNLQGQNLLAQLPPSQSGQTFQKGDLLLLQVTQAPAKPQGLAQSAAAAPSLTLRLLPQAPGNPVTAVPSVHAPSSNPTPAAPPTQAVLENALAAAQVPASSAHLAAAAVLLAHGLPLDPATLNLVLRQAATLLDPASQQQAVPSAGAPQATAVLAVLDHALAALRMAVQTAPQGQRLALRQAVQVIEQAIAGTPPAAAGQSGAIAALGQAVQEMLNKPTAPGIQALRQAALNLQASAVNGSTAAATTLLQAAEAPRAPGSKRREQTSDAELEAPGLPVAKPGLDRWPREAVYEAVAWLHARGLPPQRPLVEAAAAFLNTGGQCLDLAQRAVETGALLPPELLQTQASLARAYADVTQALAGSSLDLEGAALAAQLQAWPLAAGLEAGGEDGSTPTLKAALNALKDELQAALRRDPSNGPLGSAAQDADAALQSLASLSLQARPAPSHHSISLPLAFPPQGPLTEGRLSVTWRHGQDRSLGDKEPVQMALSLNTQNLGEVRVQLQVWKGSASATVRAADDGARSFLEGGADELRAAFAERTPFKLQNLGFDLIPAEAAAPDLGPSPAPSGLNVSA